MAHSSYVNGVPASAYILPLPLPTQYDCQQELMKERIKNQLQDVELQVAIFI